ncbi:hypothetical protein [Agriterribacter sp.]|nr:hypothetical protein [Agriterribacter sp.]HRP58038.1 hypothetical protein [Agriterribacter sp.]
MSVFIKNRLFFGKVSYWCQAGVKEDYHPGLFGHGGSSVAPATILPAGTP